MAVITKTIQAGDTSTRLTEMHKALPPQPHQHDSTPVADVVHGLTQA
jgi:hypothetical protein